MIRELVVPLLAAEALKPTGCHGAGVGGRCGQQRGQFWFSVLACAKVELEPGVKVWKKTCVHVQLADLPVPSGGQAVRWPSTLRPNAARITALL